MLHIFFLQGKRCFFQTRHSCLLQEHHNTGTITDIVQIAGRRSSRLSNCASLTNTHMMLKRLHIIPRPSREVKLSTEVQTIHEHEQLLLTILPTIRTNYATINQLTETILSSNHQKKYIRYHSTILLGKVSGNNCCISSQTWHKNLTSLEQGTSNQIKKIPSSTQLRANLEILISNIMHLSLTNLP